MNNGSKVKIIQNCLLKTWQTMLSILKIILQSGKLKITDYQSDNSEIVVLGNGPSLRPLIENKGDFLNGKALMAVNYAVLSESFTALKPEYYIVADPAFFFNPVHCNKLFDNLVAKTDWTMTLFVSRKAGKSALWKLKLHKRSNIKIVYFNTTPIEGFAQFTHHAFKKGWGMPRPRNVLIPAIMMALQMKFNTIYVAGADHSWLKDIWVGDDNRLYEDFKHFYDQKTASNYSSDYHLHNMLFSLGVAFRSYHEIEGFAQNIGKKIYNVTEGSYIDAFERKKI